MDHAERVVERLKGRRLSYERDLELKSCLRYLLWNLAQAPTSIAIGSSTNTVGGITYRYINVAPVIPPGAGNGSIISSLGNCNAPGTRIVRIRITNSVPFASGTSCNHVFSTAVSAGIENTAIFAYVNGLNTYLGTPQNYNYNTPGTCIDNVVFNSCVGVSASLSAIVSNETCLNSLDGAINLTATGGTPSPVFAWSGPAGYTSSSEDLTGLAPGVYTVIASSGVCTTTQSYTVVAGIPITINTTKTTEPYFSINSKAFARANSLNLAAFIGLSIE